MFNLTKIIIINIVILSFLLPMDLNFAAAQSLMLDPALAPAEPPAPAVEVLPEQPLPTDPAVEELPAPATALPPVAPAPPVAAPAPVATPAPSVGQTPAPQVSQPSNAKIKKREAQATKTISKRGA